MTGRVGSVLKNTSSRHNAMLGITIVHNFYCDDQGGLIHK